MSRSETIPPNARSIALLLSSTPTVHDAQPGVLHQLLEFSHRYTSQVLSDALVYAEHAGRPGKVEMDDVVLGVQARVGWEFGGRVPKEYTLSLATQTNAVPLPAVPEVFGVRLPPAAECLTAVDFDLIPNKPPPEVKQYDEEVEEVEESESDEDEEMEQADIPVAPSAWGAPQTPVQPRVQQAAAAPPPAVNPMQHPMAVQAPSDVDMGGTGGDDGSENEEDDGLFAGGEEEEESDDAMEEVQSAPAENGVKRKLVEEDNYD